MQKEKAHRHWTSDEKADKSGRVVVAYNTSMATLRFPFVERESRNGERNYFLFYASISIKSSFFTTTFPSGMCILFIMPEVAERI